MFGDCRTEKIQNYCLLCVTVDVYLRFERRQTIPTDFSLSLRSHGNISHPVSCDEFFPHHY